LTTSFAERCALDLDISAILLAEGLVGEIFGWDLVDWPAVQSHKGRKYFFERQQQGQPSIHDQLKPIFDCCDPWTNDFSPLKPSPIVNHNLTKLVGLLCRHIGRHALPIDGRDGPARERTAEQDRLHLAVIDQVLDRIDRNPILCERAALIKRVAAAAENELERHFADLINEHLDNNFLPGGRLDSIKINRLRDQARRQVQATCYLNQQELAGLAVPDLARDEAALTRIEMAKILLGRFPYMRNYELMLLAELAMLERPLKPRFARERMLLHKTGTIDAALIERQDDAIAALSLHQGKTFSSAGPCALINRTIAICGSGPLPLSALFLHFFTGTNVVLIDQDPAAVKRSKRLITNLERLEILEPGVLLVQQQNAGRVRFFSSDMPPEKMPDTAVACDAVMIASLVDPKARASIADQFSNDPSAPEFLIMRSTTGLSAKLAYDPVPTEAFSRGHLVFCGETLPATQVATHLDRSAAIQRGVACTESPDVLAIAHPDVVNTTEIYRRIRSHQEAFDLDFSACETIEDWIKMLEGVRA